MASSDIWLDDIGLLVADVPWPALLAGLRATGEGYEILATAPDWRAWMVQGGGEGVDRLLAGELDGRSYVYMPSPMYGGTADLVTAVAAQTGSLVLGYTHQDNTGISSATAARGDHLLRYVVFYAGHADDHVEGAALPGEPSSEDAWESVARLHVLPEVLRAHGFDVEGWLERGEKWDVRYTPFDPERQPEEHARLYFGPLRQRVAAQEESFLMAEDEEGEDS